MSKRKDRERFMAMKRANPDYVGFRGHISAADRPGPSDVLSLTCSVCGRKRNVPAGEKVEDPTKYVCLSCREKSPAQSP